MRGRLLVLLLVAAGCGRSDDSSAPPSSGPAEWEALGCTWEDQVAAGTGIGGAAGSIALASDGGVVVDGGYNPTPEEVRSWLRRYSATGEVLWTTEEEAGIGSGVGAAADMALDREDRIGFTGWITTAERAEHVWIAKHRANGSKAWSFDLGIEGRGEKACFAPGGELYVAGTITDPEHGGGSLIWVGKFSRDGTAEWTHSEGDLRPGQNEAVAIVCDETGGAVVLGSPRRSDPGATSGYDYGWIRRYDPAGEERWTTTIGEAFDGGAGPEAMLLGPTGDELLVTVFNLSLIELYRVDLESGAIRSEAPAPERRMLAADQGGLLVDGSFDVESDPDCDDEQGRPCTFIDYYGYAYFDWDAEPVWWRAESNGRPDSDDSWMTSLAARDGTVAIAGKKENERWVCYR